MNLQFCSFPIPPPKHTQEAPATAPHSLFESLPPSLQITTLCWLSSCLMGPFSGSPLPARLLNVAGDTEPWGLGLSQFLSSLLSLGSHPWPVHTKVCIPGLTAPLSSGLVHSVAPWITIPASPITWPKRHPRCPPPHPLLPVIL